MLQKLSQILRLFLFHSFQNLFRLLFREIPQEIRGITG